MAVIKSSSSDKKFDRYKKTLRLDTKPKSPAPAPTTKSANTGSFLTNFADKLNTTSNRKVGYRKAISDTIGSAIKASQQQQQQQPQQQGFAAPNQNILSYAEASQRAQNQLDPIYQRAIENVRKQEHPAKLDASQVAAARGLSHSGLAADQLNKISMNTQSNIANLDAERSSKTAEMAQSLMNRSEDRADRLRQQAFQEYMGQQQLGLQRDQFGFQKDQQEIQNRANYQGRYVPTGAMELINQLGSLKQQAESGDITASRRDALSGQADGIRSQLAQMGVPTNLLGANVSYEQLLQNLPRAFETQQSQNQRFQQEFSQDQFSYQQARDMIQDQKWKVQFDEDARRFGLQFALEKQVQLGNLSLAQASQALNESQFDWSKYVDQQNIDLSWARQQLAVDQFNRPYEELTAAQKQQVDQWAQEFEVDQMWKMKEYELATMPQPKDENLKDYTSQLNKRHLEEITNGDPYNPKGTGRYKVADPKALAQDILSLGLSDEAEIQLLAMYGLPTTDEEFSAMFGTEMAGDTSASNFLE